MKRISLILLCFLLIVSSITVSAVEPRWSNTRWVTLYHEYIDGDAHCEVEIGGFSGTTRIDNVDINLYQILNDTFSVWVGNWEDLYVDGSVFYFYEIVENVQSGYIYRLTVSADVHRNGTVESVSLHQDVEF